MVTGRDIGVAMVLPKMRRGHGQKVKEDSGGEASVRRKDREVRKGHGHWKEEEVVEEERPWSGR